MLFRQELTWYVVKDGRYLQNHDRRAFDWRWVPLPEFADVFSKEDAMEMCLRFDAVAVQF